MNYSSTAASFIRLSNTRCVQLTEQDTTLVWNSVGWQSDKRQNFVKHSKLNKRVFSVPPTVVPMLGESLVGSHRLSNKLSNFSYCGIKKNLLFLTPVCRESSHSWMEEDKDQMVDGWEKHICIVVVVWVLLLLRLHWTNEISSSYQHVPLNTHHVATCYRRLRQQAANKAKT